MADATLNMPAPLQMACQGRPLDELLEAEWLVTNGLGAYASSSAIGCNTRRYHGLLVASTRPPVGRLVTLSTVMEQVVVPDDQFSLGTNEFAGAFSPAGHRLLQRLETDGASARFVYRCGELELVKEIILAAKANAVAIRYTLTGGSARLRLRPFAALRNFHHVRRADQSNQMTFDAATDGLVIHDRRTIAHGLHLTAPGLSFTPDLQWWYRFHYRADAARGQGEPEDLYSPGVFSRELADGEQAVLFASLD
ncbi:MAG: glycogen debranching enzyme N-terminal domain-containing protein, partial [Planctomycetota bacterium]